MEATPHLYLYRRIVQAKLFIDAHFAEAIDLDNIAGEAWFSKYHFIRLFRKTYGKTPHQYLISVRIGQAKKLLSDGTPVAETCYAVGFESVSSFTGLFRKMAGVNPSAYRREQVQRKEEIAQAPLRFVPGCFAEKIFDV
jgi:AraC-like DNA-binding protein